MANPRIPFLWSPDRRPLSGPENKRLLVHVVVNVEVWPFSSLMPRQLIPGPHGVAVVPDIPNYSWYEYGMRCGLPRLMRILAERELPASASMNAAVIEEYPRVADAILGAGWEFVGHGVRQRSLVSEEDEVGIIGATLEKIEAFAGLRPRGWLGPGQAESFDTPDHLRKAGIDYVFDWVLDDLPCWMETQHGPLLALPYSLELNDSLLHAVESQPSDSVYVRVSDTLETLAGELDAQPHVLTLPLHPHLYGVPHRALHIAKTLDLLARRTDTLFVTGRDLDTWYRSADPCVG